MILMRLTSPDCEPFGSDATSRSTPSTRNRTRTPDVIRLEVDVARALPYRVTEHLVDDTNDRHVAIHRPTKAVAMSTLVVVARNRPRAGEARGFR